MHRAAPLTPEVDFSTVHCWRQESAQLHHALTQDPEGPNAWMLRIRLDIFAYLLHRYGPDDDSVDQALASQKEPSPVTSLPTDFGLAQAPRLTSHLAWARPPQSRHQRKSGLSRITQANRPRHERYERERADALWRHMTTTGALQQLVEQIVERQRDDFAGTTPADFDLADLILDEIKRQAR